MAKLSPVFNDQTFNVNGDPAVGDKLFTFVANSSTKTPVYTNEAGTTPHTNPIIFDSLGFPTQGPIWIPEGTEIKFVWAPATDTDPPTSPIKTIDNVSGVGDNTVSVSQWVSSGVTPTYVSANSFTLIGDQTSEFHVGRRVQFTVGAGTVYGNITASVFTTLTTITMQMDAGMVLDAGLTVANLSILRADRLAIPSILNQSFAMSGTSFIGAKGATIAGATTIAVFGATDGNVVDISGSGWTCTSLGTSPQAGYIIEGTFTGSGTFTQSPNLNINNAGQSIGVLAGWKYRAVANSTTQIDLTIFPNYQNTIRGELVGLTMSTAGASATMSVSAGQATDSTNSIPLILPTAISKTTSAWAVGTALGGLDTGAIANSTGYYFYLIRRPDTGVVDLIFSINSALPTLPANYTQYRYIGFGRTNASAQWQPFFQVGDEFYWLTPPVDVDTTTLGAASTTFTLPNVPAGRRVKVKMNAWTFAAGVGTFIYIREPSMVDLAPASSTSPLTSLRDPTAGNGMAAQMECYTNTSAQIAARADGANRTLRIAVLGYVDLRGKDL